MFKGNNNSNNRFYGYDTCQLVLSGTAVPAKNCRISLGVKKAGLIPWVGGPQMLLLGFT